MNFHFRSVYFPSLLALVLVIATQVLGAEGKRTVFFGTYSGGGSQGIYSSTFNAVTGEVGPVKLAAISEHPSFLALHPTRPLLYAVNEVGNYQGTSAGGVSAYRVKDDGTLDLINQVSSSGGAPCHLTVDRTGRYVLVANYSGGNVASFKIGEDGCLGDRVGFVQHRGSSINPQRQKEPHAHSIDVDASNQWVYAADLGTDQVLVYRLNSETGALESNVPGAISMPPGSGPRHVSFHPTSPFAYVIHELSSTVTSYAVDRRTGGWLPMQSLSTLPDDFSGTSYTAEIFVHPSGHFVYGSNRGHDSLAVYGVDSKSGHLTRTAIISTQGQTPRSFGIHPSGDYLFAANQNSASVTIFKVDTTNGNLTETGIRLKVPNPVCVVFGSVHP